VLFPKFPGKHAKSRGLCAKARHPLPPAGSRCVSCPRRPPLPPLLILEAPLPPPARCGRRERPLETPLHATPLLLLPFFLPWPLFLFSLCFLPVTCKQHHGRPLAPPSRPLPSPTDALRRFPSTSSISTPEESSQNARGSHHGRRFPAGSDRRRAKFRRHRTSSGRTNSTGALLVSQGSEWTPFPFLFPHRITASTLLCRSPPWPAALAELARLACPLGPGPSGHWPGSKDPGYKKVPCSLF
jgi:hypothetical protein